jgi:putative transposase
MERWRTRGDVSPGSSRGRIRSPLHPHRLWLLKLVAAQPDLTLIEVQHGLADRGVTIGIGSIWRFFAREGISFKKNAASIRAGQARRRAQKGKLEKASGKS